jgi:hypothetical protein
VAARTAPTGVRADVNTSRSVVMGHDGTVNDLLVVYLDSIDERLLEYLDEEDEVHGSLAFSEYLSARHNGPRWDP